MTWQRIESAPAHKRLIVFGKGGVRFAVRDDDGQWRNMMGRPFDNAPTHWMHLPEPPTETMTR